MLRYLLMIFRFISGLSVQENNCPNCWGTQEWETQYCSRAIDIDKAQRQRGSIQKTFIRKFVEQNIPGGR